jgi:hypothetical protein
MITFVLVCLAALVVVALVARIMDVTGASTWRTAAVERRQRWEARFAGGGTGERRGMMLRRRA